MGRHGGLAVLNLEGIFSRYANPAEVLERIVSASQEEATKIIQSIYGEPPDAHSRGKDKCQATRTLVVAGASRLWRPHSLLP